MKGLNAKKMSESDYKLWSDRSKISYALEKQKANGYTDEEAREIAETSFAKLLPQGQNTPDHYLRTVRNEAGDLVGFYWFAATGAVGNRKAFIYDIIIEENMRSQGFGRKTMELIEAEVRELGLKSVALHVFTNNKVAVGLYESLGFESTDIVMEKKLLRE